MVKKDTLKLEKLLLSRKAHRSAATQLITEASHLLAIDDLSASEARQLEEASILLEQKQSDIANKSEEIEDLTPFEDIESEIIAADDALSGIQITITDIKRKLETHASRLQAPTATSSPMALGSGIKLAKLDLPSFTGSYTEWTSFISIFKAAVGDKTHLADAQKLAYLKSATKGDAARLIAALPISDGSYPIALKLLCDRYSNDRVITRAHVQAICAHPAIKTESSTAMRKLQATVTEHILALQTRGVKTDEADAFTVFIVSEKLDPESRKQWELQKPGNDPQTLNELLEFIDSRARALEFPDN